MSKSMMRAFHQIKEAAAEMSGIDPIATMTLLPDGISVYSYLITENGTYLEHYYMVKWDELGKDGENPILSRHPRTSLFLA